jgi:hypothetical protein
MRLLEIIASTRKVQHRLHECAESIRKTEQRKQDQNMARTEPPNPLEVRAIVSYDQKTVTDATAQDKRNHSTQESIKNATWAAFYAVAAYAVITTFMWCQMMKQTRAMNGQLEQMRTSNKLAKTQ